MADVVPPPVLRPMRRAHLVGIGGAGMCGIAEIILRHGVAVSGSDLLLSATTERLARLGARVARGHDGGAVVGADVVVASSAIDAANVEVARARQLGIPVISRAEMLCELMRCRYGIAVAGSHGKTTTASLIASIFEAAGLDPTFVIGASVASEGGNARLGASPYFIAEADESDASFLRLQPLLAVVTSIDRDHLETYGQDGERLQRAFLDFAHRLPFYGVAVVGVDDPGARRLAGCLARPTRTYGFAADADFRATQVRSGERVWTFTAGRADAAALPIELPLPGCHNVLNALAAVVVATEEGVADDAIVTGLAEFRGVERRFATAHCVLAGRRITLVDDYGHHPTEIARIIDTVRRMWPQRRLVMVYQPHRYTRTRDLLDDFAAVLRRADLLLLAEVYGAGEPPIAGADSRALLRAVAGREGRLPECAATPQEAFERLLAVVADGDVVVVQGAGDISQVADAVVASQRSGP